MKFQNVSYYTHNTSMKDVSTSVPIFSWACEYVHNSLTGNEVRYEELWQTLRREREVRLPRGKWVEMMNWKGCQRSWGKKCTHIR